MKSINWTTSNGQKVEITVTSDYELNSQGRRKDHGCKTVVIKATLDGESVSTAGGIRPVTHPVIVSMLGKLGLTPENHESVQNAIESVRAEIADHNNAISQHEDKLNQFDLDGEAIEKQMGY